MTEINVNTASNNVLVVSLHLVLLRVFHGTYAQSVVLLVLLSTTVASKAEFDLSSAL